MTRVFLSGSRKISRLNDAIRNRLENIVSQGFCVMLGDANGADKAMQQYFADVGYQNVVIFCAGNACRNNLGNWEAKFVNVDPNLKGRDFYTQKDKAMAAGADYGLVLWDGKSPGSLNNILELLKLERKSLVYFAPAKNFLTVSDEKDVNALVAKCDARDLAVLSKKVSLPTSIREAVQPAQQAMNF